MTMVDETIKNHIISCLVELACKRWLHVIRFDHLIQLEWHICQIMLWQYQSDPKITKAT